MVLINSFELRNYYAFDVVFHLNCSCSKCDFCLSKTNNLNHSCEHKCTKNCTHNCGNNTCTHANCGGKHE